MSNIQVTNHDMVMPEGLAERKYSGDSSNKLIWQEKIKSLEAKHGAYVVNDYQFEVLKSIVGTAPEFGPGKSQFKLAESNYFYSEHPFINSVNERLSAISKEGNLQAINGDSDLDLFARFIAAWGAQRQGHNLQHDITLHSIFNGAQSDGGNIVMFLVSIDDELFSLSMANHFINKFGSKKSIIESEYIDILHTMKLWCTGYDNSADQYCPLDGAKLNEFRLNSADNNDNQNKIAAAINAFLSCSAQDMKLTLSYPEFQVLPEFQHPPQPNFIGGLVEKMLSVASNIMTTAQDYLRVNEADVFEHNFFNVTETE